MNKLDPLAPHRLQAPSCKASRPRIHAETFGPVYCNPRNPKQHDHLNTKVTLEPWTQDFSPKFLHPQAPNTWHQYPTESAELIKPCLVHTERHVLSTLLQERDGGLWGVRTPGLRVWGFRGRSED